jgi:hypothetical protein
MNAMAVGHDSMKMPIRRPVLRTLLLLLLLVVATVHGDESLSKADLVAARTSLAATR